MRKNAEQHAFSRTLSSISCQDGLTTTFSSGLSSPNAAGRSRTRRRWKARAEQPSVPTGNLKVLNALAPVLALAALRTNQPGVPAGASSRSGRPASRSGPTLPQKYCYIFHVMTSCEFTPRWPSRSERPRPGCPFFRHGVLWWVERPTDKLWPPFREADWRDSCRRGRFLRASHVRRSAGGRSPATGVTEGAISFIRGFDPRTRGALFFFVHVFVRKNAEQHPFSRTLSSISCQDGLTTTFSSGLSSPNAAGRSRTRRR